MDKEWAGKAVSIQCKGKLGIFQGIISQCSASQISIVRAFRNGIPLKKQNARVTLPSNDILKISLLPNSEFIRTYNEYHNNHNDSSNNIDNNDSNNISNNDTVINVHDVSEIMKNDDTFRNSATPAYATVNGNNKWNSRNSVRNLSLIHI